MSEHEKVVIFLNHPDTLPEVIEVLRARHPNVHVAAVLPGNHPLTPSQLSAADEVVVCDFPSFSPRHLGGIKRLLKSLRAREIDLLLLQYESLKLRVFGALVQPKECVSWLSNGQMYPLSTSLLATLADLAVCRFRGYGTLLWVLFQAHCAPVRPEAKK